MGPLGTQELVFIFILALLLFGPKKLPELGKTIGKAMTEFRRAQSELKTTFDREMKNLELETGINELNATSFQSNSYNYDHSTYDAAHYEGAYDSSYHSEATTPLIEGASALSGAGSTAALHVEAAAGSIPSGHQQPDHAQHLLTSATPVPAEHGSSAPAATVEKPV